MHEVSPAEESVPGGSNRGERERSEPVMLGTMHELDLILTLTGGLAAALICGYVTFRLGLSPIVGYLIAGFVVGPNTPGFVANKHLADELAEVGVILLMFGVGLQFHLNPFSAHLLRYFSEFLRLIEGRVP